MSTLLQSCTLLVAQHCLQMAHGCAWTEEPCKRFRALTRGAVHSSDGEGYPVTLSSMREQVVKSSTFSMAELISRTNN